MIPPWHCVLSPDAINAPPRTCGTMRRGANKPTSLFPSRSLESSFECQDFHTMSGRAKSENSRDQFGASRDLSETPFGLPPFSCLVNPSGVSFGVFPYFQQVRLTEDIGVFQIVDLRFKGNTASNSVAVILFIGLYYTSIQVLIQSYSSSLSSSSATLDSYLR